VKIFVLINNHFCSRYAPNLYYIHQVNGVKLAEIMFSLLCMCALSPIGLNGQNAQRCIQLMHEKLRIFLYRQYVIGDVV